MKHKIIINVTDPNGRKANVLRGADMKLPARFFQKILSPILTESGSSGAGKTYISNALCVEALHQLRTVKYIRANNLLMESERARQLNQAYEYTNQLASYDLLVIDDFGLMELDIDKCRDLFEVIESRDCKKSTMIVSQFPVIKWWDFFKNNTYADACLSRMTTKAYRLECNGRDMRKG